MSQPLTAGQSRRSVSPTDPHGDVPVAALRRPRQSTEHQRLTIGLHAHPPARTLVRRRRSIGGGVEGMISAAAAHGQRRVLAQSGRAHLAESPFCRRVR